MVSEIVDERFSIEQLAGSGGMGTVYRARDARTGAAVALKVLVGHLREDARVRFEREARISNVDWRDSFLRNVPENARTLHLAQRWLED